ncbi:Laccase-1 precursor [Neofusicoccum parvum]|uniref:Laccase-1 n=1 Tax=Neofusicoccum parvum TaxID=310453 RepID=A0ACB5SPW2_9PEZI|nr:Laccase-1 precursor [Neofusicoccum parvum]GME51164.1 Laccase-1 precursor [Neofusicoccum parvum]
MVSLKQIGVTLLALTAQTFAAAIPEAEQPDLVVRQATTTTATASSTTSRVPDSACTWGPKSRGCWKSGLSIATDFDTKYPTTGKTVKYTLEITNVTDCNSYMSKGIGDGFCRPMLLINNQFPGPTINAEWGDNLELTVVNNMQDNGTSIHWHGIRQLNSCQMDGANGVTECPIPPGKSFTYKFQATQYGTTWYHSHHSAQYGDGIAGAIVINGPATANYDEDLGPVALTETYDQTAWQKNHYILRNGAPPKPLNILFNGSMINNTGGGQYNSITVQQGKTYRLRFINMSVDSFFVVSLDGHQFQVITSDLVPVTPYNATSIMIGIGQRYDIVFKADQPASNYWIRSEIASCSQNTITDYANIVPGGILNYQGVDATDLPVSTTSTIETRDCIAEPIDKLVPWWKTTVPRDQFEAQIQDINLTFNGNATIGTESGFVQWFLNDSAMDVNWGKPTLQYFADGNTDYEKSMNVWQMPAEGKWSFWMIHNNLITFAIEHPIHLHGHDFFHLGSGVGAWDGNLDNLKFDNPMRRDVMILPASTSGGYLIIAFPADNPGAWLMHCHIAWHVTDGLSLQFVENPSGFKGDLNSITQTCADWNAYEPAYPREKGDSGL